MGLCVLMGLGSLTAVFSIAKAVLLHDVWATDFTWLTVTPGYWAMLEQHFGIIPSSLPALKPLFNKLMTVVSTSNKTSNRTYALNRWRSGSKVPRLPTQNPISTFNMSLMGQSSRNDWEIEQLQMEKERNESSKNYKRLEKEMPKKGMDELHGMRSPNTSISGLYDSKKWPKTEKRQIGEFDFSQD